MLKGSRVRDSQQRDDRRPRLRVARVLGHGRL